MSRQGGLSATVTSTISKIAYEATNNFPLFIYSPSTIIDKLTKALAAAIVGTNYQPNLLHSARRTSSNPQTFHRSREFYQNFVYRHVSCY